MEIKNAHFPDVKSVIDSLKPGYPVYCLRPNELKRSASVFLEHFPGRVLYAVKCNPHTVVLKSLYEAGIRHFDTASLVEVATVRENFPDADAYFMHPVKPRASILSAHNVYGVAHWVIDHESELDKLIEVAGPGNGQVVLVRIHTKSFGAAYELSDKFGAPVQQSASLLERVAREGYQPGLAFHVGSQCRTPDAFRDAIASVGEIIKQANTPIQYLDVGGGFPAHYMNDEPPAFIDYVDAIKESIEKINLRGDCVLMCEPGRAIVASGCSLITQVQLRKDNALYINDGIYHSLSECLAANIHYPIRAHRLSGDLSDKRSPFTIYGPTCDSLDVIPYQIDLPMDINEGDWIEFGQIGAYSNSLTTQFNGFYPETFVTIDEGPLLP
jgi:ornithine decarboxylase